MKKIGTMIRVFRLYGTGLVLSLQGVLRGVGY